MSKIYVCLECQARMHWHPDREMWVCPECGDGFGTNEAMPDCFESLSPKLWRDFQIDLRWDRAFGDFNRALNDRDDDRPLWD